MGPTRWVGAQGTVKCFDGEVSPARLQYIAHPAFPASQSSDWQPAQKRDSTLQYGPRQSALCAASQTGSLVKQTVKPDQGQVCCNSGANCERRAGDYTFFDTTCAARLCYHAPRDLLGSYAGSKVYAPAARTRTASKLRGCTSDCLMS